MYLGTERQGWRLESRKPYYTFDRFKFSRKSGGHIFSSTCAILCHKNGSWWMGWMHREVLYGWMVTIKVGHG